MHDAEPRSGSFGLWGAVGPHVLSFSGTQNRSAACSNPEVLPCLAQNGNITLSKWLCCAGVATEEGIWLSPGLNLSTTVSVPALSIPPSNLNLMVAGANGVVQQSITLRVSSSLSH